MAEPRAPSGEMRHALHKGGAQRISVTGKRQTCKLRRYVPLYFSNPAAMVSCKA